MIAKPVVTAAAAVTRVQPGMTVLLPGFLACGTPETLVDALVAARIGDLTIVCNDSAYPDRGVGKLIHHRLIRRLVTTHQGTNPEIRSQMGGDGLQIELVPQGTLIERIRAGGAGLGGVLTPTGLGTPVENGKHRIAVNGREFLLETPIRGDVALVRAETGDRAGNLIYRHTARNYNPVMATAADWVIAEVARIVEMGELDPDRIETPGIYIDELVIRPT